MHQQTRPGTTNIRTGADDSYLVLMVRALIGYPSTAIVRSPLVKMLGGFNVSLPPREDWELFSKCALIGGAGFTGKPTVNICVHGCYSLHEDLIFNLTYYIFRV